MKTLYTLLVIALFSTFGAQAQSKVSYDNSKWFLGLNLGGTYHSRTEVNVNALYRAGLGFTLGKSYNMEKGNLLSWDFRFRYLHANYRGLSKSKYNLDTTNTQQLNLGAVLDQYQQNYGYYVPNFNTKVNDFSLELQLNTNRLRERTGWNLFVFGGLGVTHYKTDVDLTQGSSIKNEDELFDRPDFATLYETKSAERVEIMPHFGAGIERQLSPNVSFGIMGRMSWTRHNDFDGMPNNMDGTVSNINDRYHYVSAGFKFYLGRGSQSNQTGTVPAPLPTPIEYTGGSTPSPTPQKPVVDFTNPNHSPITVFNPNFHIDANVFYVTGKNNISFKHNGYITNDFIYNSNTDEFDSDVILQPGQNIFEISGTNTAGSDEEITLIILSIPEVEEMNPPIVTITSPNISPYTIEVNSINIIGTVLNVEVQSDIDIRFNGNTISNFSFNTTNKQVQVQLNDLVLGVNILSIKGTNNVGQDMATTTLIYKIPEAPKPPIVSFINPGSSPIAVFVSNYTVVSKVLHVNSVSDITVKMNGNEITSFNYASSSNLVSFTVGLNYGVNVFEVKGINQYGQDVATTTIVLEREVVLESKPVVTIISPATDNIVFDVQNIIVNATVLNVDNASDIEVKFNGVITSDFTFNQVTKVLNLPVTLVNGNNSVYIKGTNTSGVDSKTRLIIYKLAVRPTPPSVVFTNPPITPFNVISSPFVMSATTTNVDVKNQIILKVNGVVILDSQYSFTNNTIQYNTILNYGNTIFEITVSNTFGSDSKLAIVSLKEKEPCVTPVVGGVIPQPNTTVTNPAVTIKAQVNNYIVGTVIELFHNGVSVGNMTYNIATNTASKQLVMLAGSNSFTIHVSNQCGTNKSAFILILKQAEVPCDKPIISTTQVISGPTYDSVYNFFFEVQNVVGVTNIIATVNSVIVPVSLNGNASTFMIDDAVLNVGVNTVVIDAINNCGRDQYIYSIVRENCDKPVVILTSAIMVDSDSYVLTASVTEVTSNNDITVEVNGQSVKFTFNNVTGIITANVNLQEGDNTIRFIVNGCEKEEVSFIVTYTIPCNTPIINFVTVTNYDNNFYPLKVILTNVNSASELTLKVNGQIEAFDFNNGVLTATLSLSENGSDIEITANTCEAVINTMHVDYLIPCNAPIVNIAKIGKVSDVNLNVSNNVEYTLLAQVTNMNDPNGVTVKVNGIIVSSVFNNVQQFVTAQFPVVNGVNTVEIIVVGCETVIVTETFTVIPPCHTPVINFVTVTNYDNNFYPLKAILTNVNSASELTLKVNGQAEAFDFINGVLTATLSLSENGSDVEITANTCEEVINTMHVDYLIPCHTPVINFVTVTNYDNNFYPLKAILTNVSSASELTLKVNGQIKAFDFTNGVLTATLSLSENGSDIEITANTCEEVINTMHVDYLMPCIPPIIKIDKISKVTSARSLNGGKNVEYILIAEVTNMNDPNGVTVKVNGTIVTSTFNNVQQFVTAKFPVIVGVNTVEIIVVGCETVIKTETFTHSANNEQNKVVVDKPTIKPVSPTTTRKTVTSNKFYFKAKTTSIENKSQVKLVVNGRAQNYFIYSKRTHNVSGTLNLRKGMNSIVVTVTNSKGLSTLKYDVNYIPKPKVTKPKPVVTKPKPKVTKPKPVVTKSKPKVTKPTVTKSKPKVTKPKVTKSKPKVIKPKPTVTEPKPTVTKSKPEEKGTGRR